MHRRLLRYRVEFQGTNNTTVSVPYADDLQRNFAWFCYGTMPGWNGLSSTDNSQVLTFPSKTMGSMPAVHLLATAADVENSQFNGRFNEQFLPGTVVFDGKVYDHIRFRNRGETTTYMTGKNKWRFNFNRGHELVPPIDYAHNLEKPWRRLNLNPGTIPYNPPFRGNASLHERIGLRVHQLVGLPASDTCYLQLRVIDHATESGPSQYDGDVWGLYMGFEAIDRRYLHNHGLPDGELHKLSQSGTVQKRTAPEGAHADQFHEFWVSARRRQNEAWWRSQIDIDHYASYHAVSIAVARRDQKRNHNYSLFRHPDRGWMPLPWDLDMCMWPVAYHPHAYRWQTMLKNSVLHCPNLHVHYQNRGREILDLLLQEDQVNAMVDELADPLTQHGNLGFADLDALLWNYHPRTSSRHRGTYFRNPIYPGEGAAPIRFEAEGIVGRVAYCKDYLTAHPNTSRNRLRSWKGWGYRQLSEDCRDPYIPGRPRVTLEQINGALVAQCSAFDDPNGPDTFAAQAWRIGEVAYPGIEGYAEGSPCVFEIAPVLENQSAEFSPTYTVPLAELKPGNRYRVRCRFKDRTDRWGHWSSPAEFTAPNPDLSIFEPLRISEIMYHPQQPTGSERAVSAIDSDYEFLELHNRGNRAIPLGDLRFTSGIEFAFGSARVQALEPGDRIVIVRNLDAFRVRYPDTSINVAGSWGSGRLSNKGEKVELSFGWHSPIVTVDYDDEGEWPAAADGGGASLELERDEEQWKASEGSGGTPGTG